MIGTKVTFPGIDGRVYTGIVKEMQSKKYHVKYDGYDFEAWLVREQFTIVNVGANNIQSIQDQVPTLQNNGNNNTQSLKSIFDFGNQMGWVCW